MEKTTFKKFLQVLDKMEMMEANENRFYESFQRLASDMNIQCSDKECMEGFRFLLNSHNLISYGNAFDLSQPFYVYARSHSNSELEAYSLFEALLQDKRILNTIDLHKDLPFHLLDPLMHYLLRNSILLSHSKIDEKYLNICQWILEDVKKGYNCSYALKTLYTHELYHSVKLIFKNEDKPVISFPRYHQMKKIYSQRGIPQDRECSKELQAFFKDCLFNEFRHRCVLCNIDLPHMLIASHIKPFRDCGYLVEAMDSQNGLLLCRNHDYLFDQGYIAFNNKGQLLISEEIDPARYSLSKDFMLEDTYLSETRKMYLHYHRTHYFKKKD